jgi:tetrathionate reductase subunit B
MRYAFVIDVRRCIGCKACMVACKSEWQVPIGYSRIWVKDTGLRGTFPELKFDFVTGNCHHCAKPPCIEVCPNGSTYQRPDGIVVIDQDACLGCGLCIKACPYDARYYNPEKGVTDKCNMCFTRLDQGMQPACVESCVGGARIFGDIDDPESHISRLIHDNKDNITRMISADVDTDPQIYYIGLKDVPAGLLPLPHAPQLESAAAAWKNIARPVVIGLIGATFIGQAVAYANQLLKGEEELDEY